MVTKYADPHGVGGLAADFVTNYLTTPAAQLSLAIANGRYPANTVAGKGVHDPVLAEFGKAGAGGVPMPNIPQMNSVWADLGAAWVKATKGSGSTSAKTAFTAASRSIADKIG
jgi:arabinogalactan oligomer/maltooligosaccharide transport system substrate-binding protein